ncbi:MAG: DUF2147 domain-containing protein [Pseudomonadota bacterium]
MRVIGLAVALCIASMAGASGDVDGLWRTEANDEGVYLTVQIGACEARADRVCGVVMDRIDSAGESGESDVIGKHIIKNMRSVGTGRWGKGTIWAPDDDKTYKSKMALVDKGLKVSGCVFGGLICRGQVWQRVN